MLGAVAKRLFSSQANPQNRPTKVIENLLKQHGPKTVNECWKLAEPAGIKSKTHLKTMLHWLVDRDRVMVKCNHIKHSSSTHKKGGQPKGRGKELKSGQGAKEFLFGIKYKSVKKTEQALESNSLDEVEIQTEATSVSL